MSSPANSVYNDDTQSDDSTLPYQETNGAHPPVFTLNDEANEYSLTVEEFQWMERLDHYVTKRLMEVAGELDHLKDGHQREPEWTDLAIETAGLIDQLETGRQLTIREMYFNIIKKKRITLSALNYDPVVQILKSAHVGLDFTDEEYKELAYKHQQDYISMPVHINRMNCDKMKDINPFLLLEL